MSITLWPLTDGPPCSSVLAHMTRRVNWQRRGLAALLIAGLFSLCGCVYLRLNTVRKQLSDFDHYVAVSGEPDLALNFKQPVLLSEDLVFLFKQPPTEQRANGPITTCLWVLEKEQTPAVKGEPPLRFTFSTVFTSNKLSQFIIPREVLRVVPRNAVVGMFKAIGHAQVHTARHSADTEFPSGTPAAGQFIANTLDVTRLFGAPHETQSDGKATTWSYRFVLRPPAGYREAGMSVRARFDFRAGDACMTAAQVEFSGHQMNVRM
jgi:hypothetical protein